MNEIEFASGRVDVPTGTLEENALVFQASEDRRVIAVMQDTDSASATTTEVSFSSRILTDSQPVSDEISSGILLLASSAVSWTAGPWPVEIAPVWDAGEEINVHVDNAGPDSSLIVVNIAYVPVGEFLRERLRNR